MMAMDQNLGHHGTSKSKAIVKNSISEAKDGKITTKNAFSSSLAGHLKTHLKTHGGEKTNKCNQCGYASSQAGHLRIHLQIHSGVKPQKCNQCDYASSYVSALRTHLKTHSGEKTNKCNQLSIKTEAEVAKPGKEVISSKTHADLNGFFKDFVLKSEMETEATMNKN